LRREGGGLASFADAVNLAEQLNILPIFGGVAPPMTPDGALLLQNGIDRKDLARFRPSCAFIQ
jgi:hypothetical protein